MTATDPARKQTPRERLADPLGSLAAFVVDRNVAAKGLAACTVGVIAHRLERRPSAATQSTLLDLVLLWFRPEERPPSLAGCFGSWSG